MNAPTSAARNIIVIGGSAGALESLLAVVGGLTAPFPGTILVVVHQPQGRDTALPRILTRAGPLPASVATEGAALQAGHIYLAPPDTRHLIVGPGTAHLVFGPRENYVRPAVDPLFRSAAEAYGPRVVGVVLSGTGADGTEGLRTIKAAGGVAIAQDPREALYPGMPDYAVRNDDIDFVLPVAEIAPVLERLARGLPEETRAEHEAQDPDDDPAQPDAADPWPAKPVLQQSEGFVIGLTCPECGGPMWEVPGGAARRFACRVGHRWSGVASFAASQTQRLEALAWGLINALGERALLLSRLMAEDSRDDPSRVAEAGTARQETERLAQLLREHLPHIL